MLKKAELNSNLVTEVGKKVTLYGLDKIANQAGGGKNHWVKIGTITVTGQYVNRPLTFEVTGRGYETSILQIIFQSVGNSDPGIGSFTNTNGRQFRLYKSATSTWILYGKYNEAWGSLTISRIYGAGLDGGISVSLAMENVGYDDPTATVVSCTPGFFYAGAIETTKASIDTGY